MVVSVNGAELFYSTRGTGVTCIVPSILGTKPYERLTPPPLTDHFRFVYVDLRGGGKSTGNPADLTFDVLASDLDAVRADLGVEQVIVLGYSILGVVAIEYGRRCPEHVSHVITAGTPPAGDIEALVKAGAAFFEADGSDERKAILRDNYAKLPPGTPPTQAVFAQTPMRFFDPRFDALPLFAEAEFKPELFQHMLGPLTANWNVTSDTKSLGVPILIAHGRFDYVSPYTMWKGIVETLPNATMHLFQRSGHQTFFEEPAEFARVVREWMAATQPPAIIS
jgi:proline iminopeptidase